jgi:hypothetical protein
MDENEKLKIKRIQHDIRVVWNEPTIEEAAKHRTLNDSMLQLIDIKDTVLFEGIQEYFTKMDTLEKELERLEKERNKLLLDYRENMQETYNELMKL